MLDGEIEQVTAWIADMLAAADTIKVDQQEAEFRQEAEFWREQERVQAERDVSPRWCIVYDTLDEFIAEDPRRQARAWTLPVVAGADFGYDWHRDLDDGPDAPGRWSLYYIASRSSSTPTPPTPARKEESPSFKCSDRRKLLRVWLTPDVW
ncbi:hypothetical protein C5C18_09770 [Rathayibacter tritici]|uniref:hypothetical protein n=1 Tax=Rathayibacter tritici TaxID=33888 RepID=UPI000CE84A63|nr:hypothetical protein [Rathayibacter tritici]PPF66091.1 hypothetical protein C5C21_10050 [Rathayibacter tritici]PPG06660.1 hypothetical protein C5C18_09770 [Rathayibacter tritici]